MRRVLSVVTLLVAFALLAAACTTRDLDHVWSKPGASAQQVTLDDWECRREVYASAPRTVDVFIGGVADAVRTVEDEKLREETYATCMRARGYERAR